MIDVNVKVKNGNDTLFSDNMKIAYDVFQKYKDKINMEEEDLKQLCLMALWKSVIHFKPEKGFAFSTYAYNVICRSVCSEIDDSKKKGLNLVYIDDCVSKDSYNGDNYKSSIIDILSIEDGNKVEKALEDKIDVKNISDSMSKNTYRYLLLRQWGYGVAQIKGMLNLNQGDLRRIKYELSKIRKENNS